MTRMKLSAAIAATTLFLFLCGSAVQAGIVNGDFSATTLTGGGKAVYTDKDAGWFAKNAYDGTAPDNWRIQSTGYMEMLSNSGTKTRYGQVFSAGDMTGKGWSLEFDLGGSFTNVEAVQVWAGLEVASPPGGNTVVNLNSDSGPDNAIVQGSWVQLVNESTLTSGSHVYALAGDLDMSSYDIMALRFRARGAGVGAQYDDVEFVQAAPAVVPNLIQHLDASVPTSVTANPGVVTSWDDQSTYDNDASSAVGSPTFPSTSLSGSGLPGIDMGTNRNSLELFSAADSDAWLDQSGADPSGFAALVAFKADALVGEWNDVIGNTSAVNSGFGMRYGSGGLMQAYLKTTLNKGGSNLKVEAGDTIVFGMNYDAALGKYEFWDSKNGTSAFKSIAPADFSTGQPVTLGSTNNGTRYMNGMVGEVKIFDAMLDATAFAAEHDAMARQWTGIVTFDGDTDQTWGIDANWHTDGIPETNEHVIIHEIGTTAAGRLVTLKVSGLSPTVSSLQVYHTGTNTQQLTIGGDNDGTWNTLTVSDDHGGSGDLILGDAGSTGAATVRVDREGHLIVEGDIVSANDANHTILLRYVENKFTLHGDIGSAASTNTIDLDIIRVANLDLFAGTDQSINVDDFLFNVNVDGSLGGGRTITVGNGDSFVSTGDAIIGKNTKPQFGGNDKRTTSAYFNVDSGGTAEFNTLTLGAVRGANGPGLDKKGIGGITVDGTFTVNGLLTMATTDDYTPAIAESRLTVNAGAVVTLDGGVATCTGENDYTRSATITINGGDVTLGGDLTLGVGTNTTNTITLAGGKTDFGGNNVVLSPDGSGGTGLQTFNWSGGTLADVGTFGTSLTQGDDTGNTARLQIGADDAIGTMTIEGDYDLLGDGILEIDIDGLNGPGVDGGHDQLVVDGAADLNGMLRIDTDGYIPPLDSFFDVLIGDPTDTITLGSAFSLNTANAPLLPVQFWYVDPDLLELGTLRLLIGVPEPSTFLLAALGFVGLVWCGRRRRR